MVAPIFLIAFLNPSYFIVLAQSMITGLQQNCETYKKIKHPFSRIRGTYCRNITFSRLCFISLLICVSLLWLFSLLLICGDKHPNPGPDPDIDFADEESDLSMCSLETLSNNLSIFHLNIQSIMPKLDLLKCETETYDILVLTESWLKPHIHDDSLHIENFNSPFRKDRCDRAGGGVAVYVRDSIVCKRRGDLEINDLEAVWVEVRVKSKVLLIGGFYRPPNSDNNYFNLILESLDRAYNTNIIDIIILGDLNYNMISGGNNKISDLSQLFNLKQLITEATHFTEDSSSLIDIILARNPANILLSGVIDSFIPNQVRYHCPIIVLLKFTKQPIKAYKRQI